MQKKPKFAVENASVDKLECVIPADKKKPFFLLLVSGAIFPFCILMAQDRPLAGWLPAAFFGLCMCTFGFTLFSNKVHLKLDSHGFEMVHGRFKYRTYWKDVERFELYTNRHIKMIGVIYRETYEPQKLLRGVNALLTENEGAIADIYALPCTELLQVLNDWNERYGHREV